MMDAYEGWAPDPFEAHELRFFVDGLPTKLVKDGSAEAFDDLPPKSAWPSSLLPPELATPTPTPTAAGPTEPAPVQSPEQSTAPAPEQSTAPAAEQSTPPAPEQPTQPPWPPPLGTSYWSPPPPAPRPGADAPSMFPGSGEPVRPGVGLADTFAVGSGPAITRRPRRRMVTALVVLVLAVAAGGVFAVVSGSKSAAAAVIDSVNSTMADRTAHVVMTTTEDSSSSHVSATGVGGVDFSQSALQLQFTVDADGQHIPITALYLSGSIYESIAGLDQLIPGKSWISLDVGSAATGQGPGAFSTGNNPTAMLRLLAQQGNAVVALGPSTIGGTSVQGYQVKLTPAAIKAQLAKANLPAWVTSALNLVHIQSVTNKVYVDGAGLLRRYSLSLTESTASTGKITVNDSLDFSEYGTPVSVQAPPPDQVVTFQQFLQAAQAAQATAGSSAT
jgi:hypothetical protein